MAPPAAPTGLTLTAKGTGFGAATLGWTHAGTTKYQVLYKRPYDADWKTLHIANAAAFGAGPYSFEVPLTDGVRFTVCAINAAGEASALATELVSTLQVKGIWFLPFADGEIDDSAWAFITGGSPELTHERDGVLLVVPSREEAISIGTGIVHKGTGTAEGQLYDYEGTTADEWRRRLNALVSDQKRYRWVWLSTKRDLYKVELIGPVTRSVEVMGDGAAYRYSVGIREL